MKKIAIIGTGYVGLVSGAGLAEFGHNVSCVDIDQEKIKNLNNGQIPIHEPGLDIIVKNNTREGRLTFSSNIEKNIQEAKIIFIAVGTPQDEKGIADLTAVKSVVTLIADNLNNYKIICTKSTVPIGTGKWIESEIKSRASNDNFDYVSNPEFLREGAAVNDFLYPDRIVLGSLSEKAFSEMREIYRPLYINKTPIIETSVETAEMIKYASNSFLALKISYINEIANLCEAVGADIHQVARAMGQDGRISSKFLHPGPGFGGSCFPKDLEALYNLGKEKNIDLNTVSATIKTNKSKKKRITDKLLHLLNNKVKNKKIAILGLSFKPNTDDIRESASLNIVLNLIDLGADLSVYDPAAMENFKSVYPNINYNENWRDCVKNADACVVLTEWNEFRGIDLSELKTLLKSPILLDAKNIFSIKKLKNLEYSYDNIGRNSI